MNLPDFRCELDRLRAAAPVEDGNVDPVANLDTTKSEPHIEIIPMISYIQIHLSSVKRMDS